MDNAGRRRRKLLPHFPAIARHNETPIHFVTACTWPRHPLLASGPIHRLLREAWSNADYFLVGRYVVMPDHIRRRPPASHPQPVFGLFARSRPRSDQMRRSQTGQPRPAPTPLAQRCRFPPHRAPIVRKANLPVLHQSFNASILRRQTGQLSKDEKSTF